MTLTVIIAFGFILPICMLILSIYRDRQRAKLAEYLAQQEADRKQREAERKSAAAKRAAQEAENRRRQEAEAQQAAKVAAQEQKRAEREKREAERKAAAEAKHLETMRRREELHQQKLRQLAELQAAQAALQPDTIEKEQPVPVKPEPRKDPQQPAAPAPFAGQRVAFTGKIPGYTHAEAAKAVQLRGGTAYEKAMPAGTTLLVIGQHKPGQEESGKIVKADQWIGQIKKITAAQFVQIITTNPIN